MGNVLAPQLFVDAHTRSRGRVPSSVCRASPAQASPLRSPNTSIRMVLSAHQQPTYLSQTPLPVRPFISQIKRISPSCGCKNRQRPSRQSCTLSPHSRYRLYPRPEPIWLLGVQHPATNHHPQSVQQPVAARPISANSVPQLHSTPSYSPNPSPHRRSNTEQHLAHLLLGRLHIPHLVHLPLPIPAHPRHQPRFSRLGQRRQRPTNELFPDPQAPELGRRKELVERPRLGLHAPHRSIPPCKRPIVFSLPLLFPQIGAGSHIRCSASTMRCTYRSSPGSSIRHPRSRLSAFTA